VLGWRRTVRAASGTSAYASLAGPRDQIRLLKAVGVFQPGVSDVLLELLHAHAIDRVGSTRWTAADGCRLAAQPAAAAPAPIDRFAIRFPVLACVRACAVRILCAAAHVAGKLELREELVAVRTDGLDLHLLAAALLHVEREATQQDHLPA
jgi:hypothetical protein